MIRTFVAIALGFVCLSHATRGEEVSFARDVQPILVKYCVGCHNDREHPGEVQLNRWSSVLNGGESGAIVVAGDVEQSLMLQLMRSVKEPKMPPIEEPQPDQAEIELIARWIEQGAKGSDERIPLKDRLIVKSNATAKSTTRPITAIDLPPGDGTVWIGSHDALESQIDGKRIKLPIEVVGKVAQIRTTPDGRFTAIASGIPGVGGQATIVAHRDQPSGRPHAVRVIEGHNDTLYSAVISPDGKILATGGYDRVIQLWNVEDGTLIRRLDGHNGAIYDLDFDATGNVLASASADETIKVWNVATGERLDTFGQCEAEQYTVRFDFVRGRIMAAGADRRIRIWKLVSLDKPSVSPMLFSTFAHEGAVSFLCLSADGNFIASVGDDKQIKLWSAEDALPIGVVGKLEDTPSGLYWDSRNLSLIVSTLGGDLRSFPVRESMTRSITQLPVNGPSSNQGPTSPRIEAPVASIVELDGHRTIGTAQAISAPCEVTGKLLPEDMQNEFAGDWYALDARRGDAWIVSINAAQSGSPLDSLLDILNAKGEPLLRTRLQAVRETYFTFQGKGSVSPDDFRLHRWEDMELNEYLYAGGEVVKLWLYPRGPDSGFKVYPGVGTRFSYFDTTATTHALNEPAWIVRELEEGEQPIPNGLPIMPIYYSNDDAGHRKSGKDSELFFECKQDGRYLIRVRDARGQSGETYRYQLSIQAPNPRFTVRAEVNEITLRPGVGIEFPIVADRFDRFDGGIEIRAEGLPEHLQLASPLSIEAGQLRAIGNVFVGDADAALASAEFDLNLVGRGRIRGEVVDVPFSQPIKVKWNAKPAMKAKIVAKDQSDQAPPLNTLVIHPGETISAHLVIERDGNLGDIAFGGDDSGRNLPHGCYVDNIGLNGLLIPAGQSMREFFITAAPWVSPQERKFHLRAQVDGNPTTLPVTIRVQAR